MEQTTGTPAGGEGGSSGLPPGVQLEGANNPTTTTAPNAGTPAASFEDGGDTGTGMQNWNLVSIVGLACIGAFIFMGIYHYREKIKQQREDSKKKDKEIEALKKEVKDINHKLQS